MSHSATESSQHSGNQTSWIRIPSNDASELFEASKTEAEGTRDEASLRDAEEHNGLLTAGVIMSHRPSTSTMSSQTSGSIVPKVLLSEVADQCETLSQPNVEDS